MLRHCPPRGGTSTSANHIAQDAAEATWQANTLRCRIATLILPGDTAWSVGRPAAEPLNCEAPKATFPSGDSFDAAVSALRIGQKVLFVLSGRALRSGPLETVSRLANRSGAHFIAMRANGRIEPGAGRVAIQRAPVPVDEGLATIKEHAYVIPVGAWFRESATHLDASATPVPTAPR